MPPSSPPTAEILSQGDEVVTGQVADTNAAWLATRLTDLGFRVVRHTSVGDHLPHLEEAVGAVLARCDLCVCTGGLGPTRDDLTAQAVAQALDRPLELDEQALESIVALYERHNRTMPAVNRKQALLPRGAHRLDNDRGTAPGFLVSRDPEGMAGPWLACLPGVPHEMRAMCDGQLVRRLFERFSLQPAFLVTLRTTGVGESNLQERIGALAFPDAVLGFRTQLPENHVKLRFAAEVDPARRLEVARQVAERIGSPLFSVEGVTQPVGHANVEGGPLAEVVGRALVGTGATLATAESCTGGRVAALCTAIPGSSDWFSEGVVTYSNAAKQQRLGVAPELLAAHGAVSEPVARAMAEGVRATAGTTYGLSTTGIAGPGGATEGKPVGTVHIALAGPDDTFHRVLLLGGRRTRIQELAAAAVLDLLRRSLQSVLAKR